MNEKPILFNAEMVNAILSGRKTQTRRIMKVQPSEHFHPQTIHGAMDFTAHWYTPGVIDKDGYLQPARKDVFGVADEDEGYTCPLGAVGDHLWVREAFATGLCTESTLAYRATHQPDDLEEGWFEKIKWTPSIHMPRWASRINLLITGVRVERLQDISEQDAAAEGCLYGKGNGEIDLAVRPENHFPTLWASIYGAESWQANPWVWVIDFERMEAK
ncbi:hypothetical protein GBL98_21100 [Yersinia pseudotuberculosis]|uniref:hypothetical protein n=1 Tax=Yersinia pseudotuberculosis TaxID=633 RepID=UPI001A9DDFDF|nr:hypothetical protein [Yersinia pseudotuberculosis]MBO1609359.1 hypothetical protein [Yersinia pseudotuberculosis]MBO1613450.1 hypothetical protein [Yersinia pseudotuberculosis]MBO1623563.1 hypothetical protein [Yersinia pseudotuberculosis]